MCAQFTHPPPALRPSTIASYAWLAGPGLGLGLDLDLDPGLGPGPGPGPDMRVDLD
jgi:hypothetical protein